MYVVPMAWIRHVANELGPDSSVVLGALQAAGLAPGVLAGDVRVVRARHFVDFVEAGVTDTPDVLRVAEEYLAPLRHAGIDTLVLGCTHYPFLEGAISYVMGPDVSLVSSDTETAKDVYRQLVSRDLLAGPDAEPTHVYEATGDSAEDFLRLADRLMGRGVSSVRLVQTGAIDLPKETS